MNDTKATSDDVRHAYRLFLGREPDADGFKHNCELVDQRGLSPLQLGQRFMESTEFHSLYAGRNVFPDLIQPAPSEARLKCQSCTQEQIESSNFRYWASRIHEMPGKLHRKLWEWCFIMQALHERGMLHSGARGLGFAVGTEPLTSLFASMGCDVLATDLGRMDAAKGGWVNTNQNAASLDDLNERRLCMPEDFASRVGFRQVDMCAIPSDLRGFDFLWSSCAMEHLGSLGRGMDFVLNAMSCLRPGGDRRSHDRVQLRLGSSHGQIW